MTTSVYRDNEGPVLLAGNLAHGPQRLRDSVRILKADRQRLTTNLYRLRKYHACRERYDYLVSRLGDDYGDRKPINLLTILEHNGVDDTLWALQATHQNSDRVARLMTAAFAEDVLPIFERLRPDDKRPRKTIQVARSYARGKAKPQELLTAMAAAGAAATDAAATDATATDAEGAWAARAAAEAAKVAAMAAAGAARYATAVRAAAAARAAAWAARYAGAAAHVRAAAEKRQATIIRRYLLTDEGAA